MKLEIHTAEGIYILDDKSLYFKDRSNRTKELNVDKEFIKLFNSAIEKAEERKKDILNWGKQNDIR